MAAVTIQDLSRIYPEKNGPGVKAVDRISLQIRDGEFMVLVGPSGCGKSTTLRMIAGLEEISGGTISIGDQIVNNVLPKDRDIAMVFQNYALYPHMNVYDNMAFGLKLRKFPKAEIDARVREAAAMLGLEAYLDRIPKALSGGQRQRVAVGRAIVRKPKVFLFDEPLSNLDAKMRASMRREIAQLHDRLGTTMIYVTHDQVEAMTMGDRICVMKDGHIVQVDEPIALYRSPAHRFVAGFIGSPPMNFLPGTIRPDPLPTFVSQVRDRNGRPLEILLEPALAASLASRIARPVTLGIRPEHVSRVGEPEAPHPAGPPVLARVALIEPMGSETLVHLELGGLLLIAKARPNVAYSIGEDFPLRFDLDHLRLFDDATDASLN